MSIHPLTAALAHLTRQTESAAGGMPDAELLQRFTRSHDEAAFELLVRRHGGLVMAACRRVLGPSADVDDAFQAAFLALARRAATLRRGEAVAAWLHQVAVRAALRLRTAAHCRKTLPLPEIIAPPVALPDDTAAVLDEEIARLPDKLRIVFVLCELDGRTDAEAAAHLGCPKGTVLSRLSRARSRLRDRLTRRGLVPMVGAGVSFSATTLNAALVAKTVRAGVEFASGGVAASAAAAQLANEILRPLTLSVWKPAVVAVFGVVLAAATAAGVALAAARDTGPVSEPPAAAEPIEPGRHPDGDPVKPDGQALPPAEAVARFGNEQFLHPAPVSHVLFSKDGKEVATVGSGTLRWWNLADGSLASEPIEARDQKLPAAIAPLISPDNGTLVQVQPTAGLGSILAVYDVRTGERRCLITVADNIGLAGLRVSHNGKWAAGLGGKTVVVWDLAAGKKARSIEVPGVQHVAVSNDGKHVALDIQWHKTQIRAADTGALVWEVTKDYPPSPKNQPPRENLESHQGLAFSPDGKRLATTGIIAAKGEPFPAPVRVWDIENKKHLWAEHVGNRSHGPLGREMRFSPDGKYVCTVFGNLYLLEAETGKLAHEFHAGAGAAGTFAIANDGKWAAMAAGRRLRLWDTATHKESAALIGPRNPARLIARSPDGKFVATGNGGQEVWVWNARGGVPSPVRASDQYWAFDLGFSPDSTRLMTVTRGNNNPVRVWDAATGKHLYSLGFGADKLHRAAFGRHGLFAVLDYVPGLYDADTGKAIWTGKEVPSHGNNEPLVAISPRAEAFVTNAKVFSVRTGKELAAFNAGFPLAVSDDGKRVVYRTKDGKIGLHDSAAQRQAEPVAVGAVFGISPGADRLAAVVGLSLRVYDLTSGKKVAECERPAAVDAERWKKWWARGVSFSQDSKRLVAHADTPGLGVWDAATGKALAWFVPDLNLPLSACMCTGPRTAVAAYGNGDLICVWDIAKAARP